MTSAGSRVRLTADSAASCKLKVEGEAKVPPDIGENKMSALLLERGSTCRVCGGGPIESHWCPSHSPRAHSGTRVQVPGLGDGRGELARCPHGKAQNLGKETDPLGPNPAERGASFWEGAGCCRVSRGLLRRPGQQQQCGASSSPVVPELRVADSLVKSLAPQPCRHLSKTHSQHHRATAGTQLGRQEHPTGLQIQDAPP